MRCCIAQLRVICFALILSGVLLGCSNVAGGAIVPDPKPAQLPPAPEFDSLQMIDRENGWAKRAAAVFRTNQQHECKFSRVDLGRRGAPGIRRPAPLPCLRWCDRISERPHRLAVRINGEHHTRFSLYDRRCRTDLAGTDTPFALLASRWPDGANWPAAFFSNGRQRWNHCSRVPADRS